MVASETEPPPWPTLKLTWTSAMGRLSSSVTNTTTDSGNSRPGAPVCPVPELTLRVVASGGPGETQKGPPHLRSSPPQPCMDNAAASAARSAVSFVCPTKGHQGVCVMTRILVSLVGSGCQVCDLHHFEAGTPT